MKLNSQFILILSLMILTFSCVEEIDLITETEFESVLVIEATITNELNQQKILLSRAFRLEEEGPSPESNATVNVVDSNGIIYNFQEVESGVYLSSNAFAAQPNIDYHLEVATSDNRVYSSSITQLTQQTQIDNLYVERGFNENGDEGVSVFVDSFDPTGNSKFYRYTYEETYKIIAPNYSPFELIIQNDDFPYFPEEFIGFTALEIVEFFVLIQLREEQEQVCYNTVKSNRVILVNTNIFEEDRVDEFRVRFINRNNYIMSHRYSILVRQYVQSQEAHTFYEVLNNFSSSGSLFSQVQPGFLSGNVFSKIDKNEKVIGFFEVSSVDEKRVYFNYADLFSGDILPPYYILHCNEFFSPALYASDPLTGVIGHSPIQDAIKKGHQHWKDNFVNEEIFYPTPYQMVFTACGDCTAIGSTTVPDFWED